MRIELEDLTKPELIKLFRAHCFNSPTQRECIGLRWESMAEESNRIMAAANQESQKWTGIKTFEALAKWNKAQKLFDKGMALADKAEELFDELRGIKD